MSPTNEQVPSPAIRMVAHVLFRSPPQYLGVTPPVSVSEPTSREKEITLSLMEELRRQGAFEREQESKTRCVIRLASSSRPLLPRIRVSTHLPLIRFSHHAVAEILQSFLFVRLSAFIGVLT